MNGKDFFVSAPGRIACATGIVALGGPGAMALTGPTSQDVRVAACIVIACILGCAATAMLSVYRFPWATLAIILAMPIVAGFYVAGLSLVSGLGSGVGIALLGFALLPLATAVVAPFRHDAPSEDRASTAHAVRARA